MLYHEQLSTALDEDGKDPNLVERQVPNIVGVD